MDHQSYEYDKWDLRFLKLARHVATWSKDPSSKHGAVVVVDRRAIGMGFNGFPPNIEDSKDRLENRDFKYKHVVHAEVNALLNCVTSAAHATLYVTSIPCIRCMSTILASRMVQIERVVYIEPTEDYLSRWGEDAVLSKAVMEEAMVYYTQVPRDELTPEGS